MQRTLLGFFVALAAVTFGCGGDPPPKVYGDMQWRLRCDEFGGCAGIRDRSILGLDGDEGQSVDCSQSSSDGTTTLFISAYNRSNPDDQFGIAINNLRVPSGGGGVVGTCNVSVLESGNTFQGLCGATMATSEAQPCYIASVMFSDSEAGPRVSFTMQCTDLPNQADATIKRELTRPGDSTMPAFFEITSCSE
jgi:hypothetical protein